MCGTLLCQKFPSHLSVQHNKKEFVQYHGEKKLHLLLPVPTRKPEKPPTLLSRLHRKTPKTADDRFQNRILCSFSFSFLTTAKRQHMKLLFLTTLLR